ncbi:ribosomal protein S5-alanine N-acetyltransferase [Pseudoalteromonas fenneropenaei]|uniref:Ribosomal protein S5-alanine N-acetyltransferase n=1 Tax=Pseudoalteromonas fenneropenaei TaxID=1737459 RepID=A0ABV7CJ17_9GAMM
MSPAIPEISTDNLVITQLLPQDFPLLAKYERENRAHLAPWEPSRDKDYFSDAAIEKRLTQLFAQFQAGNSLFLVGLNHSRSQIICVCHFSNIVYGAFQACHLGYSIAASAQGKGLMFEMLNPAIDYVFKNYGLHRIMANYLPHNQRSENLLMRLGFEREGYAKSYLNIAGTWQDHVLTAKLNPEHIES